MSLSIQYDNKLKQEIKNNLDSSGCDMQKKFQIIRKTESGNLGYIKNAYKNKFDIFKLYKEFIVNLEKYSDYKEIKILQKYTLEDLKNKTIAYDDLAGVMYLNSLINEYPYYSKLRCVFIDEAQDLSDLMFKALRKLFKNASFSIFGDVAQGIYSYQAISDWKNPLEIIGECELLYLKRSYRTSIEIMQEANKVLGKLGFTPAENVVRYGDKVDCFEACDYSTIKNQLEDLNKKYSHTAIICKSSDELENAQKLLKDLNLIVLDENNLSYSDYKNCLLTVQTAKGLEFDSVIIFDRSSYDDKVANDLKLLYVAQTRALHKLIINGMKNK